MADISGLRAGRAAVQRWRRSLRQRLLTPVMVGVRSFREAVLNALAGRGHLVYCRLPEGSFFVDPSDRTIGSWLMWHGRWQREEIDQAIAVLERAGRLPAEAVFVDAGANIGTHTVYAMRKRHFARAVAFEPEPKNAELLVMNMAANGLADRVIVIPKALGASERTDTLHLHPRNKGAHAIGAAPSIDGIESVEVSVVRLDAALENLSIRPSQIGLVWIDVEGAEFDMLKGLGEMIGQVPLVIEYAPDRYPPPDREAFRRLLLERYANFHRVGSDGGEPLSAEAFGRIESITDILVY